MKRFTIILIFCFSQFRVTFSQNSEWFIYNDSNSELPHNSVLAVAIDTSNNKWIGTANGLARFDGLNWEIYNTSNSNFANNNIITIYIDDNSKKWFGSLDGLYNDQCNEFNGGICQYLSNFMSRTITIDSEGNSWIGGVGLAIKEDGSDWEIYYNNNSGLPDNNIFSIAIDSENNKWIGTAKGLVKFDGANWTTYDISNSEIPDNVVRAIVIDSENLVWVGTENGLAKFDGSLWTVFNTSNSELPTNAIWSLAIDLGDNKWVGTYNGLAKFDNNNWEVFTNSNSELPDNFINSITIDIRGNKWIGTENGLAVYREDGVVDINEIYNFYKVPNSFSLFQNYPNPFNPVSTIKYSLPENSFVTLKVHDILGREITTLVNEEKYAGNYSVIFDGSGLSSGIYFYTIKTNKYSNTKKLVLMK